MDATTATACDGGATGPSSRVSAREVEEASGGTRPSRRFELLSQLMERRTDLQGTYDLADYLHECVRWTA